MEGCASEDYSFLLLSETIIRTQFNQDAHITENSCLHRLNVMAHPFTQFVRHYSVPGQRAHVAFSRALSELLMLKPTRNHRPRISTVYPGPRLSRLLSFPASRTATADRGDGPTESMCRVYTLL